MLKKQITYKDLNDEEVTETVYFNLSKPELIELEVENAAGLEATLQRIIESNDHKEIVEMFKKIVLMAYGKKSDDGRRFIKNDQLREEFQQSVAYSEIFMELATDAKAAGEFIQGVIPADLAAETPTIASQTPPPPPSVPTPPTPPTI